MKRIHNPEIRIQKLLRGRPLELVQQSTSRKSGKLSGVLTRDPGGS